jgi:hypothetical protein
MSFLVAYALQILATVGPVYRAAAVMALLKSRVSSPAREGENGPEKAPTGSPSALGLEKASSSAGGVVPSILFKANPSLP